MIILDTNVVSEALRSQPSPAVVAWLDRQDVAALAFTAIGLAELRFGVAMLPKGRRRDRLASDLEDQVYALFGTRILSFDAKCATAYAEARANAARHGKAIAAADGYIAAIAIAHSLAIATRDTAPFRAAGLQVINPWTEA